VLAANPEKHLMYCGESAQSENLMQKQEYMHLLMENTTILLYRHLLFVKNQSPQVKDCFQFLFSGELELSGILAIAALQAADPAFKILAVRQCEKEGLYGVDDGTWRPCKSGFPETDNQHLNTARPSRFMMLASALKH